MTQKMQTLHSTPYSDQISVGDRIGERPVTETPFDESIESAFTHLQEILASKVSAEAELEDLFARRRNHAIEELEKARRRLEFVGAEEKRMKNLVVGECFRSAQDAVSSETTDMRKIMALSLQDDSEYCPNVPEDPTSNTQNDKFTLPEPGMEDLIGNVVPINTVIGVAIACQEMDKKLGEDAPQRAEMEQMLEDDQSVEDIRRMQDIEEEKRLHNEKERACLEELEWRRRAEELARHELEEELARRELEEEHIRIELLWRVEEEELTRFEAERELEEERLRLEIEDQTIFLEEGTEQEHVEQDMHSPDAVPLPSGTEQQKKKGKRQRVLKRLIEELESRMASKPLSAEEILEHLRMKL